MYEENKIKINWIDLVIKAVIIIALVVFLIWLVPKKDVNTLKDSIYANNINTMKDAAKSYYTKDRLPKNVGESTSMTLNEMINKHLVIQFTDKDNKVCDGSTSKVEVSKISDEEYVLRVELNCGDQKDYILETIGCYDVCKDGKCDNVINTPTLPDTPVTPDTPTVPDTPIKDTTYTTTYYQFRRLSETKNTTYTCPAGYTKNGTKCYMNSTGAIIDATPIYSPDSFVTTDAKFNYTGEYKQYIDPIVTQNNVGYTCPAGYSLNGAYCIKYTNAIKESGTVTYTCPTGYTKNGTKCSYTYNASYRSGSTTYTCPNGGTLSGTKCVITTSVNESTKKVCPSGYTANGNSCYKLYNATVGTDYTCPSGYTKSGTKCTKNEERNPSYNKTYGTWRASGGTQYKSSATATYVYETSKLEYIGAISGRTCGEPCGNKGIWYMYQYYTRTVSNNPYCTVGTLNSSKTKCIVPTTINATPNTTHNCPNGGSYDSSKGKCVLTADYITTPERTCPTGYTMSGNKCIKEYNATPHTSNGSYYCPNGGTLSGSKCTVTVNATRDVSTGRYVCPNDGSILEGTKCKYITTATRKIDYSYTCPYGYTTSGTGVNTRCYKTIKGTKTYYCEDASATLNGTKCTKKVPGTIQKYTCPSDEYVLNGTVCAKKTTIVIDATKVENVSSSYEYTWSTSKTLEGWEFTGKTKTDTYTAGQK